AHDAAIDPAGERGLVFLEAAAIVEEVTRRYVGASERTTVAPGKARMYFPVAAQKMRQLFGAAIAATVAAIVATGGIGRGRAARSVVRRGGRGSRRRRSRWCGSGRLCDGVVIVGAVFVCRRRNRMRCGIRKGGRSEKSGQGDRNRRN